MDQDYHRILEVITRFQLVFDQKNWDAFDELLADQLEVDYLQFRGSLYVWCLVMNLKVLGNKLCRIYDYSTI